MPYGARLEEVKKWTPITLDSFNIPVGAIGETLNYIKNFVRFQIHMVHWEYSRSVAGCKLVHSSMCDGEHDARKRHAIVLQFNSSKVHWSPHSIHDKCRPDSIHMCDWSYLRFYYHLFCFNQYVRMGLDLEQKKFSEHFQFSMVRLGRIGPGSGGFASLFQFIWCHWAKPCSFVSTFWRFLSSMGDWKYISINCLRRLSFKFHMVRWEYKAQSRPPPVTISFSSMVDGAVASVSRARWWFNSICAIGSKRSLANSRAFFVVSIPVVRLGESSFKIKEFYRVSFHMCDWGMILAEWWADGFLFNSYVHWEQ